MSNLILTGSLLGWVGSKINTAVQSFFLWIDSVVYWFASSCYQLFIKLSTAEIFSDSFFSNFANRIYAILGIFMLFYLAYALLNAIIDPDKLTKGDKSVSKLASNFVVSLVIIGLLPTIFSYAYNLQNFILSENVIGTLVFGTKATANEDGMVQFGDALSFTVLNTFINPQNYNVLIADDYTWFNLKQDIIENNEYGALNGLADAIVNGANVVEENGTSSETVYVEYKVILSTLVGVYLCYIMISFCLDLGVRLVKLAFCQLIAPIPVIMRAMPSKKGTFDKWLKLTLSVYFEVFVRVGFIYLSVYFINEIVSNNDLMNVFSYSGGGIQGMLALVIIILGILTFAKQAPKMISDILGIDTGNLKLGIGEKIKGTGIFKGAAVAGVGGAMIGAGATGLVRNFNKGVGNIKATWKDTQLSGTEKAKAIAVGVGGTALSTIAGATSGVFNAYTSPKNMKSVKDVKKQASAGAQKSVENRERRANYKASHGDTIRGATLGHFQDTMFGVREWAGVEFSTEALQKQVAVYEKGTNFKKQLEDIAKKKSDLIKALDGQLEAIQQKVIERDDFKITKKVPKYNPVTNLMEETTETVVDEQAYYNAINERAKQITDLKNRRDVATAKWVNEKIQAGTDNEVEAVKNAFETYVKENAAVPEIKNMKLTGEWKPEWDLSYIDANGNEVVKDTATVANILKDVKKGTSYLQNNDILKKGKEEKTKELNERIIKEQEKKK